MAKPRPSLEAIAGAVVPLPSILPLAQPSAERARPVPARSPASRAHTSIYVSKRVCRVLRRIAIETDRERAHEVMLEAIDDVLRKYGKPSIGEIDGCK
jgi:hypothetical protein